jgi:hypothetical protein
VVATVLFALEWSRPAPPPADCPLPGERRAEAGHTAELTCGGRAPGSPVRGPARRLVGLPIDPNRADAATLETLPGVGPARAFAILEARQREPFRRVQDLEKVPGIGPRTLAGLAGVLAIGEPAPASEARSEPQASEGGGAGCAGAVPAKRAQPTPTR